jgi:hypothetical protein
MLLRCFAVAAAALLLLLLLQVMLNVRDRLKSAPNGKYGKPQAPVYLYPAQQVHPRTACLVNGHMCLQGASDQCGRSKVGSSCCGLGACAAQTTGPAAGPAKRGQGVLRLGSTGVSAQPNTHVPCCGLVMCSGGWRHLSHTSG